MIPRFSFLIGSASFLLFLTIGAITSAAAQPAEQTTYYVAIDGNDAWSGTLRRAERCEGRWSVCNALPAHATPSGS